MVNINGSYGYVLRRDHGFTEQTKWDLTDLEEPETTTIGRHSYAIKNYASNGKDVIYFDIDNSIYFATNPRISGVPLHAVNGLTITSAVHIPKDKSNALFRNGSFVLLTSKWFVEVSDQFNVTLPFVPKDIIPLVCRPEIETTTQMTTKVPNSCGLPNNWYFNPILIIILSVILLS